MERCKVTRDGVRRTIRALARSFRKEDMHLNEEKVSDKVLLKTADGRKMQLYMRELKGCCGANKDKPLWRLEVSFDAWMEDDDGEEIRDAEYCDALHAHMDAFHADYQIDVFYLATFTPSLEIGYGGGANQRLDVTPQIVTAIRRLVAAEVCGCGRQILPIFPDGETDTMCYACMLGDHGQQAECPLCMSPMSDASPRTACCGRSGHHSCLRKCHDRCPYCRASPLQLKAPEIT